MNDGNSPGRRTEVTRIIECQIALALSGYSMRRRPHGYERWLVKDDGTQVRKLAKGERVRIAGHYVVWLPGDEDALRLNRRIFEMATKMPVSRIAATLAAEGIPSHHDAGTILGDR
jgi:hypothetical protein